ncbi:phosphodiester glycosidase family protein [Patescibacteria group bacterium]|nr:phosphodiester glycosidase family protein [Patescibacteria group bacterium]
MHLVSYKDIKNTNILFKWAFQNGPMLVVDGKNTRGTSDTKWNRSGIGYRRDGSVVVIYSDKPVTFREFADLFVNEGCTNAMYLDG